MWRHTRYSFAQEHASERLSWARRRLSVGLYEGGGAMGGGERGRGLGWLPGTALNLAEVLGMCDVTGEPCFEIFSER